MSEFDVLITLYNAPDRTARDDRTGAEGRALGEIWQRLEASRG